MIVTIRSFLSSHTGYGHIAEHLGIALEQLGHDVRLDDYGEQEAYGPLSEWTQRHRVTQGTGVVLNVNVPHLPAPRDLPTVFVTMWESSRLPERGFTLPYLNYCRAVVVPCQWNAVNFASEGVTTPIHVVPFGASDCYRPAPMSMDGPTRFGFAARVSHGPPRKRVKEAIAAFRAAFPRGDEDVRLHLKVGEPCMQYLGPIEDERIRLTTKALDEAEMCRWYQRMTVGILPSSGEGYGLHGIQFLRCGRPLIACQYGGRAEYFDRSCGWPIAYDEVPATGDTYDGLGNWAMPRHDSMVAALQEAHADRLECVRRGMAGAERAREFTWERSARELVPVLEGAA